MTKTTISHYGMALSLGALGAAVLVVLPLRVSPLDLALALVAGLCGAAMAWGRAAASRGGATTRAGVRAIRFGAVGIALCLVSAIVVGSGGNVLALFLIGWAAGLLVLPPARQDSAEAEGERDLRLGKLQTIQERYAEFSARRLRIFFVFGLSCCALGALDWALKGLTSAATFRVVDIGLSISLIPALLKMFWAVQRATVETGLRCARCGRYAWRFPRHLLATGTCYHCNEPLG